MRPLVTFPRDAPVCKPRGRGGEGAGCTTLKTNEEMLAVSVFVADGEGLRSRERAGEVGGRGRLREVNSWS